MITLLLTSLLAQAEEEIWLGRQVVVGTKPLMIIGDVETRTESYLLARVTRSENTLTIEQQACSVSFGEVFGVQTAMAPATLKKLPVTRFTLTLGADGALTASPWRVAWDETDLDGDGHPGVTVAISSRMCSGELFVASDTLTSIRQASLTDDRINGELTVVVDQLLLGSTARCLMLGADEQHDQQQGRFTYQRLDTTDTVTCADIPAARWPTLDMP